MSWRKNFKGSIAAAMLTLLAASAAADEPNEPIRLTAALICRAQGTVVICTLPMSVPPGMWITYAEARLLSVPDFLEPAGATRFEQDKNTKPRLRIGFVAKRPGKGTLAVEARAVVCRNHPMCPHVNKSVATVVDIPKL